MPQINGANFIVSRKETSTIIEKEDEAVGVSYHYLIGKQLSLLGFEAVILEIKPNSFRDKVVTDAYEFKYVLTHECYYIIGDEEVLLQEGDAIFFDGRIPHVPVNRGNESSKMLVLSLYFELKIEVPLMSLMNLEYMLV